MGLSQSNEATITENCRLGNRQITSKSKITESSQITLPLECSISSPIIRCGRMKYLFENEEINQARIRRVSVINTQNQIRKKNRQRNRIHYRINYRNCLFPILHFSDISFYH